MSRRTNRDQVVAAGVALSAFAGSAAHIYSVARDAGNPEIIAALHPAGLDGLIYIGIRGIGRGRKVAGWLATGYGVVASLTFNAVSYAHVPMPAWVMAVAMPVALVLAVLVVGHGADEPATGQTPPEPARTPVPAEVPDSGQKPARTDGQTNGQVHRADGGQVSRADRGQVPGQVPGQINGHTIVALPAPERADGHNGQVHRAASRTDGADRRTDAEVVAEHGEALRAERAASGKLTRYRVEKVCGIGGRQAERVLALLPVDAR